MKSYSDLRAAVLDWLDLDPNSTRYDSAIYDAANSVSGQLNRLRKLPGSLRTTQIPLSTTAVDDAFVGNPNPALTYSTDGAWDRDSIPDWTFYTAWAWDPGRDTDDPLTSELVDGTEYVYTGAAIDKEMSDSQGETEMKGVYYAQTLSFKMGVAYTVSATISVKPNTQHLQENRDLPLQILGIHPDDSEVGLDIISRSSDCFLPLGTTGSMTPYVPTITFRLQAPATNPTLTETTAEIRAGWNTEDRTVEYDPLAGPANAAADFELTRLSVTLAQDTGEEDTLINQLTLPDDCGRIETLRIGGFEVLPIDQLPAGRFLQSGHRSQGYYKVDSTLHLVGGLDPEVTESVLLTYYATIPELTAASLSHWALDKHFDIYRAGVLARVSAYLQDWDSNGVYTNDYNQLLGILQRNITDEQYQSLPTAIVRI